MRLPTSQSSLSVGVGRNGKANILLTLEVSSWTDSDRTSITSSLTIFSSFDFSTEHLRARINWSKCTNRSTKHHGSSCTFINTFLTVHRWYRENLFQCSLRHSTAYHLYIKIRTGQPCRLSVHNMKWGATFGQHCNNVAPEVLVVWGVWRRCPDLQPCYQGSVFIKQAITPLFPQFISANIIPD